MAKKSKRGAPTPKAAPKKAAPKKKSAPTKTAAAPKPALDDEQIGHVAGEVWAVLHDGGAMTFAAIKKAVDRPGETTVLAIGWLAREGKLDFTPSGRSVKVSLK